MFHLVRNKLRQSLPKVRITASQSTTWTSSSYFSVSWGRITRCMKCVTLPCCELVTRVSILQRACTTAFCQCACRSWQPRENMHDIKTKVRFCVTKPTGRFCPKSIHPFLRVSVTKLQKWFYSRGTSTGFHKQRTKWCWDCKNKVFVFATMRLSDKFHDFVKNLWALQVLGGLF